MSITASSSIFPRRELQESILVCEKSSILHKIMDGDELSIPSFTENSVG